MKITIVVCHHLLSVQLRLASVYCLHTKFTLFTLIQYTGTTFRIYSVLFAMLFTMMQSKLLDNWFKWQVNSLANYIFIEASFFVLICFYRIKNHREWHHEHSMRRQCYNLKSRRSMLFNEFKYTQQEVKVFPYFLHHLFRLEPPRFFSFGHRILWLWCIIRNVTILIELNGKMKCFPIGNLGFDRADRKCIIRWRFTKKRTMI